MINIWGKFSNHKNFVLYILASSCVTECNTTGAGSNTEVMTVGQYVEQQSSKQSGSNHCAIIYGFLTMLDIDGNIKRITTHRWYDV